MTPGTVTRKRSQRRQHVMALVAALGAALLLAGAISTLPSRTASARALSPSGSTPLGIKVVGNHLTGLDGGAPVRLLGVDRSGSEYECAFTGDKTVFDGPTDAASIQSIKSWHTNAVRIPLNEDCWLGISGAVPQLSGSVYRGAIERYVSALHAAGLYVIVDLHWAAPGSILAQQQWPMADANHAPTFWKSVATAFKSDRGVVFDLFNEPYITSWPCWKSGCRTKFTDSQGKTVTYETAGMQQLVDAVRSTGSVNPIMLGGLGYAGDESHWAKYEPEDPAHQLIVSFHTYNFSGCATASCWKATIASLARTTPVVTGEFGESGCTDSYALAYMKWADAHGVSYLGWAWDSTASGWSCSSGPALIVNYDGSPTGYGIGLRDHLAALAAAP